MDLNIPLNAVVTVKLPNSSIKVHNYSIAKCYFTLYRGFKVAEDKC